MAGRGARHQGGYGSLDNGTARPVLSPDALTESNNTEHLQGGSITKRPGRVVEGEVASQKSLFCMPLADRQVTDDNGKLIEGRTYYIRATYVTAAGETDDLHSSDPDNPGPATLEMEITAGHNGLSIAVPFHIRDTGVAENGKNAGNFLTLKLEQPDPAVSLQSPVIACDPNIYVGWLLYSRSPRFQDETALGTNCDAADPLYHRTVPYAVSTFYNPIDQTITFNRAASDIGKTGFLDRDRVDFMMPDRDGLPILSYNVYISDDNVNFFLAATGNDGSKPVVVLALDKTAARAPSTRVDRSAPALAATDVFEVQAGKPGHQLALTRLPAGIYGVRTTWWTGDQTIMGDPGFDKARTLNENAPDKPPLRAEQETWPSDVAFIPLVDNQGIDVIPAPGPDINSGWNVYCRQLRPNRILRFPPLVEQCVTIDYGDVPPVHSIAGNFPNGNVVPFTVKFYDGKGNNATDDGNGNLSGDLSGGTTGTIIYSSGGWALNFTDLYDGTLSVEFCFKGPQPRFCQDFDGDRGSPRSYDYTAGIYYGNPSVPASSFRDGSDFLEGPEQSTGLPKFYDEFYDVSNIAANNLDPFDPATRGFSPAYPDISLTLDEDDNPEFLFASSRDDIPCNRQLYWFHLDAVEDADDINLTTYAIFRITLRVRPGKLTPPIPPNTETFVPGDDQHVAARYWNESVGTPGWVYLPLLLGPQSPNGFLGITDWFEQHGSWFAWNPDFLIHGRDAMHVETTARFMVIDLTAFKCIGFDVDDVQLELYRTPQDGDPDPAPDEDEVLQREHIKDDSTVLKNPLAYRTFLTDGSDPGVGEWRSIRPNNTAQWPLMAFSLPVVGKKASSPETKVNFIGCADSTFRDKTNGSLERIFQEEGLHWNGTLRHDWQFENYLNRIFFCNEGEPRWNYRFDGLATYPMGLAKPISGVTEQDVEGGFGIQSGDVPPPTLYGDRCQQAELFAGTIVSVNETPLQEGQRDAAGNLVVGLDLEYYIVYKRLDPATGRSYIVRSEPAPFAATLRVRGTDAFQPTVTLEAWVCPEPQDTHIELYRNAFATADYYLVSDITTKVGSDYNGEGIKITDEIVDPATARVHLQLQDKIAMDDSDLTLPIEFETGRPAAAVMMKFNRGRLFFAEQKEREILAFTNIVSPSGDINPEGWFVDNVIDPPVRESAAITSISVYNDGVVCCCNTGMVSVQSIEDATNGPSGLSAALIATDAGWMGPQAFVDVDAVQYGMTRQGPAVMAGGELNFIGIPVEGTIRGMSLNTEAGFRSRAMHYRVLGRTQVWFTYTEDPGLLATKCLVFDEGIDGNAERMQFWKTWSEMPVHSLAQARDSDGNEYPLMGGHDGRLYRHGLAKTDAGLLIEHDLTTRAFEAPEPSASFQPSAAYFYTAGEPDDIMNLDVQADFEEIPRNKLPMQVAMGGDSTAIWGEVVGGSGDLWGGDGARPYVVQRINMGGAFQQIAYRLYMTWETWPAGKSREITFDTTGFNPFDEPLGVGPAKASYVGKGSR